MRPGKSLSTKIIVLVEAIILLSSAIFCAVSVSRAQNGMRQAIRQRMVDIANCAAGLVNGDILESLQAGDENTPGYRSVYDAMAVFRDNAELEYVYAIRDEGDRRFTFIVDTDPDEPGGFGEEVHYTDALYQASLGTTSADEVPYSDAWGEFYSAYSPVFDSEGRVAGIVAADFSVAWYDAQMQEQTRSNIKSYAVIVTAMLLGAAFLCFAVVRPFAKQQEQLLEEKVSAESANQAKSEFLANMSHEIRTPINAVLGMNEMILRESREGGKLPDEQARERFRQIGSYAGEVESAGRSLLTIVNGILDFSRIESGRMELVRAPYSLSFLLNDVSNMILFRAREKGLEFTLEADPSVPDSLIGDEARVREILTNILGNAVKYTEKGFVRLKVRAGERTGDTVRLTFAAEDSGIGIRREDMDKLFGKFQRLDMERNSTVEGSGLGLIITRSLLDMMGGTISVESEYGKGSVFTAVIPQEIAAADSVGDLTGRFEAEDTESPEERRAFRAPDARILVVDDTRINLVVTAGLLKNTEIQIDTASGGAEAVALAEQRAYDAILMDQRMPVMDGTEALKRIRQMKDGLNQGTPVICLTADAILGAKDRYLAEGFSDYLAKPVDSRKLETMLLKYLPGEKVRFVSAEEAKEPEPETAAQGGDCGPYRILLKAGIDAETGLKYSQDEQLYDSLLREFERAYPKKAEQMNGYFASRDWENYGILVHALKSSSRMLGISGLSAAAARLETAAKENDSETILQGHQPVMDRYGEAVRSIREFLQTAGNEEEPVVLEFAPEEGEPG